MEVSYGSLGSSEGTEVAEKGSQTSVLGFGHGDGLPNKQVEQREPLWLPPHFLLCVICTEGLCEPLYCIVQVASLLGVKQVLKASCKEIIWQWSRGLRVM